jgi:hypothetical protein
MKMNKQPEAQGTMQPRQQETRTDSWDRHNLLQNWMNGDNSNTHMLLPQPSRKRSQKRKRNRQTTQCWGCTGHTTHHTNQFHSFRDCLRQGVRTPDVRRTAFRRMKQMREEWEGRKRDQVTTAGTQSQRGQHCWQKQTQFATGRTLGFTSKKDASSPSCRSMPH